MSTPSTTETRAQHQQPRSDGDPRFEAVVQGEVVQTAVAQLTALVDECHLQLRADGIRLPATDPAAVASVDVHLHESAFESFSATEGTLGVNLTRFADLVAFADRDQPVHLSYAPETRKLHVAIGELEYTLALVDPDSIRRPPDLSDPGFEFTGHATLPPTDLSRAVDAASMVSDHVAFGIDPDAASGDSGDDGDGGVFYAAASGDTDDVDITLPADDLHALDPGDAHSRFSLDYLEDIDRAIPGDAAVDLSLGTEVPLGLASAFADGAGEVEFLLGPRIARH